MCRCVGGQAAASLTETGTGQVFPCRKRDTGHIFAMKRLDKKRLKQKHQETSAAHERNVLAEVRVR